MSHKEFVDDDFLYQENFNEPIPELIPEPISKPINENINETNLNNSINSINDTNNKNQKPKNKENIRKNSNKKLFTISNKNKEVLNILNELKNVSDSDYICQAIIEKYYKDKNISNDNKNIIVNKENLKEEMKKILNELVGENFIVLKGNNSISNFNIESNENPVINTNNDDEESKRLLMDLGDDD